MGLCSTPLTIFVAVDAEAANEPGMCRLPCNIAANTEPLCQQHANSGPTFITSWPDGATFAWSCQVIQLESVIALSRCPVHLTGVALYALNVRLSLKSPSCQMSALTG